MSEVVIEVGKRHIREINQEIQAACAAAGQPLTMRMQPGYDHSYHFIASFIEDHFEYHARYLK